MKHQLTSLLILLSLCSFGQDSLQQDLFDLTLEELSKVTISSSRRISQEKASESPATVLVLNSNHFKERGYTSLIDILEDIPDVKVDRGVDPRWFNDVTMRGVRYSDKFIILLDGVRISSPTNEILPIMENYPLHFIKQVEILYGPVSALYGADAFVGVINMVSKEVDNDGMLSGQISGGQYDTFNGNILFSSKLASDIKVMVGAHYFFDQQPDLANYYPESFEGRDQSLRNATFNTFLGPITPTTLVDAQPGFPLGASSVFSKISYKDLSLTYFRNRAQNPSSTANDPENSVYNEDQFFEQGTSMATARYFKDNDRWISNSQLTFSTYQLNPLSNFRNVFTRMEPAYLYARSWKLKGEQLFTWIFSDKLKLTTGITAERYFSIPRSNDLDEPVKNDNLSRAIIVLSQGANRPQGIDAELIETTYNSYGGLMELSIQPNDTWNFNIGSRIDKDDRFDLTFNPRIGAVYSPNDRFTAKALFGTAFLAPSPQNIFDRFGILDSNDGGLTYSSQFFALPNEGLEPQTISTIEAGLKYFITPNFCIDLTSYYSQVSNLISAVNSNVHPDRISQLYPNMEYEIGGVVFPINQIQINDNLGESKILGGHIMVNYLARTPTLNADFYMIYSYVDGTIDIDEEGAIEERNLPGVSPHQLKLGSTIRKGKFTSNLRLLLMGRQRGFATNALKSPTSNEFFEIDGYALLNVNFVYDLSESIGLTLTGRNLLDQRYRNVNIGAGVDPNLSGGAAEAEFQEGAPQNPIRITGGIRFTFK